LGNFDASAQVPATTATANQSSPAACAVQSQTWATCWFTMLSTWAPGTTLAATIKNSSVSTIVCTRESGADEGYYSGRCGVNGNSVVSNCPGGCWPGEQIVVSLLGNFTSDSAISPSDWTYNPPLPGATTPGSTFAPAAVHPLAYVADARSADAAALDAASAGPASPAACSVQSQTWATCWITVLKTWAPGTTLAATITNSQVSQILCVPEAGSDEGYFSGTCSVNGEAVVSTCPGGCWPGEQIAVSLLGNFTSAPAPSDWTYASSSSDLPDNRGALAGPGARPLADVTVPRSSLENTTVNHASGSVLVPSESKQHMSIPSLVRSMTRAIAGFLSSLRG
jgi:hypothetical protein